MASAAACSAGSAGSEGLFASVGSSEADLMRLRSILHEDMQAWDGRQPARRRAPLSGPVRRLSREWRGDFSHSLACLRPEHGEAYLRSEHAILALRPRPGRVCAHELCSLDRCGLHTREEVVLPFEAAQLVAHATQLIQQRASEGAYERVDFAESASNGSLAGHVLLLRVAERMRRIAAGLFGLPINRVRVAEHFIARHNQSAYAVSDVHVDEGLSNDFHFSSVVWLGESGKDFDSGALAIYHNRTIPWLLVEPMVGRAAFFSSGWENVHGVKVVSRGTRWSLTVVFMVHDELAPNSRPGLRFYRSYIQGEWAMAYSYCRHEWATLLGAQVHG